MRVVIPSVNYADFLAVTLPAWKRLLPSEDFLIVTSPADHETRRVAAMNEAGVVLTDVWHEQGATFNKAAALDLAFGFHKPHPWRVADGEWCLALDADVYPFGGKFPAVPGGDRRALFSVMRYSCASPEDLQSHIEGRLPVTHFEQIRMWKNRRVPDPAGLQGYFQLWRYRPGDCFGSYPTAAKYDVHFGRQFEIREYLTGMYVLHLGEHRRNWSGRITPRWDAKDVHAKLAQ
jgi:hypothetical protein